MPRSRALRKPIQREPAARLPHQPQSQQQQANIANQLCPVRRLTRGHLTSTTETAAVDAQARDRSGRDSKDEDEEQHRRRRSDGSGGDPGKQQQPQGDLREWQPPSDDGLQGGREQLVGAHRCHRGLRIDDLERSSDQEHTAQHEPRPSRDPAGSRGKPRFGGGGSAQRDRSTSSAKSCLSAADRSAWRPDHHSRVTAESDHLR